MAIDTFKWCTQVQGSGGSMTVDNNDREVVFGNGYTQVASSGYNTSTRSFTIVYAGSDWLAVKKFMDSHRLSPFAWKTPEGDLGLFRVKSNSLSSKVVSASVCEVTCTFVEQFSSSNI